MFAVNKSYLGHYMRAYMEILEIQNTYHLICLLYLNAYNGELILQISMNHKVSKCH